MMNSSSITPNSFAQRSFLYRKYKSTQTGWSQVNGYATISTLVDQDKEIEYAKQLAISDLSYIQRIGFKGAGTVDWLNKQNIQIPEMVNSSLSTDDDCLVARLGTNDILVLDNLQCTNKLPNKLEQQWHQDYLQNNQPCGFIMPRQDSHACFSITGNYSAEMFAKLCAIDLRTEKFGNNKIAQTSLARIGAIIIRHDLNSSLTSFLVLVESALAEYCWDCLINAMQEFEGKIIGISTLTALAQ